MRALIFAAGLGTRMRPLTDLMPKALIPVGGRPLLEWQIVKLREAGIRQMVVNVHYRAEQILQYLREHDNFGCDIQISDERELLLETGGGLRKVMKTYGDDEPWLALNVDILSTINLTALTAAFTDRDLAMLVVSQRPTARYLLFDEQMRLHGWTNRQTGEVRPQGVCPDGLQPMAFSGMQVVSPRLLAVMEQMPEERFSVIDLYLRTLNNPTTHGVIRGYVPANYQMRDVGKYEQLGEIEQWAATQL